MENYGIVFKKIYYDDGVILYEAVDIKKVDYDKETNFYIDELNNEYIEYNSYDVCIAPSNQKIIGEITTYDKIKEEFPECTSKNDILSDYLLEKMEYLYLGKMIDDTEYVEQIEDEINEDEMNEEEMNEEEILKNKYLDDNFFEIIPLNISFLTTLGNADEILECINGSVSYDGKITYTFDDRTMKRLLEIDSYDELKGELEAIRSIGINTLEYAKKDLENKKQESDIQKENKSVNLDDLIGLENVKEEIKKLQNYLTFLNKTKEDLNLGNPNLHMVFTGNPGTGKTTVARILARILYELGYVKCDKFKEITAGDLIAGYVGQTAEKTKNVIAKNKGGIIFIDEAYVFCSRGQEFANEALVEIIKEMDKKETVFIFAGYTNEMEDFIKMNPGIKSRIGYELGFKDYTIDQLYQIFEYKLASTKLKITEEGKEKVKKLIAECITMKNFGNGRYIDKLFDKIIINHSCRTLDAKTIEELSTITADSVEENILDTIKNKQKKLGF